MFKSYPQRKSVCSICGLWLAPNSLRYCTVPHWLSGTDSDHGACWDQTIHTSGIGLGGCSCSDNSKAVFVFGWSPIIDSVTSLIGNLHSPLGAPLDMNDHCYTVHRLVGASFEEGIANTWMSLGLTICLFTSESMWLVGLSFPGPLPYSNLLFSETWWSNSWDHEYFSQDQWLCLC